MRGGEGAALHRLGMRRMPGVTREVCGARKDESPTGGLNLKPKSGMPRLLGFNLRVSRPPLYPSS